MYDKDLHFTSICKTFINIITTFRHGSNFQFCPQGNIREFWGANSSKGIIFLLTLCLLLCFLFCVIY